MNAELATYALLAADAGVSAIVGTRIYPMILPQNVVLEALCYQLISTPRDLLLASAESSVESRIQVTAHGQQYAEVKALQNAVRAAANGYTGTPGGVTVERCEVDDGPDLYDSETGTWQASVDLLITYQET